MNQSFIYDLASNPSLREQFCQDPKAVFEKYDIPTENLDLPSNLDPAELEEKLNGLLAGTLLDGLDVNSLADMSADELWKNFLWIRRREDSEADAADTPLITVPVIITTPVTQVTVYATTGITDVIGTSGSVDGEKQLEDWKTLQELEKASPADIRVTIQGPDDAVVENLAPHVAATFIRRLFRNATSG